MCGGPSYHPLDVIHPPPPEGMIDDIREESDDDADTLRPHPRSFPITSTGFQKFDQKLQTRTIRQQRYLEVIRNRGLGVFANYDQSVVADENVTWLPKYDYIVNLLPAVSFANRKCRSSLPAAN
jgi:hypothetical protein